MDHLNDLLTLTDEVKGVLVYLRTALLYCQEEEAGRGTHLYNIAEMNRNVELAVTEESMNAVVYFLSSQAQATLQTCLRQMKDRMDQVEQKYIATLAETTPADTDVPSTSSAPAPFSL